MKILLLALLFPIMLFINGEWLTDFNQAKVKAKENHEFILLNFSGSDWCSPCIQLKRKYFQSEVFTRYAADSLVLVNADFPRLKKHLPSGEQVKKNESLADTYNPEGKFPLTLLVDSTGKVLRQWDGLPDITPEAFVAELKTFSHGTP